MKTLLLTIQLTLAAMITMAQTGDYSFKETYSVGANPKLTFTTIDGDISVSASVERQITVHFIAKRDNKLLDMNMNELSEYFNISIADNEDGLMIETRPKLGNSLLDRRNRINLDFKVFAPARTTCDLTTVDGDLSIKGLEANQQYKTTDGNISVQGIKGDVMSSTVDGDIHIQETIGRVEAKSTDGDIELGNVTGNVQLKTVDGDIAFDILAGEIISSTTDGDIQGTVSALNAPCSCRTTDGDIHMTLPNEAGFNIEMKGESLGFNFKRFEGDIKDEYLKGKVNGGGVSVTLLTNDGDIELMFK